jgi:protein-S-isoprenylcysteine O-methyltransferase Ste14
MPSRKSTKQQSMKNRGSQAQKSTKVGRAFRYFLRYDNKIFGAILALIALSSWVRFINNVQDQWVYVYHGIYSTPLLSLAVVLLSAIYTSAIGFILLTKASPMARYDTFWPNFLAALGGFGVYLFGLLEPAHVRLAGVTLPLLLLAGGAALVLLSLLYLRRSFSVTPQARSLSQRGPYAIVRHPMYLGNILSLLGLALLFGTWQAFLLSTAVSLLQISRAYFEERLLLSNFPDYEAYMSNVGAFIPRLGHLKMCKFALLLVICALGFGAYGALHIASCAAEPVSLLRATENHNPGKIWASSSLLRKVAVTGATCRGWLEQALNDDPISKADSDVFDRTSAIEETLMANPDCSQFFAYQHKCQAYYANAMETAYGELDPKPQNVMRAAIRMLNARQTEPGCKSIIGLAHTCFIVRDLARSNRTLPIQLREHLSICADESVVLSSQGLLRAML